MSKRRLPTRFLSYASGLVILFALYLAVHLAQVRRVSALSGIPDVSVSPIQIDASSLSGYASGQRTLLVPRANNESIQVILHLEQALADGAWLKKHYTHDNAPQGRPSSLPLLHRFCLGLIASIHHLFTEGPIGRSVEWTALHGDGLLYLLCAAITAAFTWCRWGPLSACGSSLLLFTYPLATAAVPGAPEHLPLTFGLATLAYVLLGAGVFTHALQTRRWTLIAAGTILGLVVSLNLLIGLTLTLGLAVAYAAASRRIASGMPAVPWPFWSIPAALTVFTVSLLDNFHTGGPTRVDQAHFAWSGLLLLTGALLSLTQPSKTSLRRHLTEGVAALLFLAIIFWIWSTGQGRPWLNDLTRTRLTGPGEVLHAENFVSWLRVDGLSFQVISCAGLLAVWLLIARRVFSQSSQKRIDPEMLAGWTMSTCALLVAVVWLRWWNVFAATLVAPVALGLAKGQNPHSARWPLLLSLGFLGLVAFVTVAIPVWTRSPDELSSSELEQLKRRDFAHWIARRSPHARVLATPGLTQNLVFHGGLEGIGTLDSGNREGFLAAKTIANAVSAREARALIQNRGIDLIVYAHWDSALEDHWKSERASDRAVFFEQLRTWLVPAFLQPIAYPGDEAGTPEATRTVLFQTVEDQSDAELAAGLATYFVEASLPAHAAAIQGYLKRFPSDAAATTALAQIAGLRGDLTLRQEHADRAKRLATGPSGKYLKWAQQVNLAAVLAQANANEEASSAARQCADGLEESVIRAASPRTLYRFVATCRHLRIEIPNTSLQFILDLLPPAYRTQLQPSVSLNAL